MKKCSVPLGLLYAFILGVAFASESTENCTINSASKSLKEAASTVSTNNTTTKTKEVCVVKNDSQVCYGGELVASFTPTATETEYAVKHELTYPYIVIVREGNASQNLKSGAAYLCNAPGKYEFLKNVDLTQADEKLVEEFLDTSSATEVVPPTQIVDFTFNNVQLRAALLSPDFHTTDILDLKRQKGINAVVTARSISDKYLDIFLQNNIKVIVGFDKLDIETGSLSCYIDAESDNPAIFAWDVSESGYAEEAARSIEEFYVNNKDKKRIPVITTPPYTMSKEK